VARGSAFVPYNQPGLAANTLLSGRLISGARLEPAETVVAEAGAGASRAASGPEAVG
jgi:hypothetical protein